ncbi:MAG: aminopeptidase P family protein [Alphaproteobacteria bacterium]|nr:aminopeptidase P family protein [Alphaproteobacteria bacterium]
MLTKLKSFLKERQIDFFFLPNSDEFFLEYLPTSEKRIEALTGFTGSNAFVFFGWEKSLFFTDGRYILQAKNELDLAEFEIFNLAEKSLLSMISADARLAVDTRLVSLDFVRQLQKKFPNLVLLKHEEIPIHLTVKPKKSQIFSVPDHVVGVDSKTKCTQLLQDLEADALLLTKPENLCWLLNVRASDLEFTPLLLTYGILLKNGEVKIFTDEFPLLDKEVKKIQLDDSATNYWLHDLLQKNNFELTHKSDPIDLIKSQKNSAEIFGATKAHEEDGLAVTKFLFWLKKGSDSFSTADEISAAKKLLELRRESPNFSGESFAAISAFASNGAVIHYRATAKTNKKISGNSLYLIDSGGQYFGEDFCGTTDVTRTVALGTPTAEMKENFTRVLQGHIALACAKFPRGTSGAQLDALARQHLWQVGLNYDHGTGHGVGSFLSVHEGPCGISKRAHQELLPGMILSNEPGFYKEGEYGIRIENLMLVEEVNKKGFLQFKTLTLAPLDPELINFSLLTAAEKKWLSDYHQEILQKFSDKLDKEGVSWLKQILSCFNSAVADNC